MQTRRWEGAAVLAVFGTIMLALAVHVQSALHRPIGTVRPAARVPITQVQSTTRRPSYSFDLRNPTIPLNDVKAGGPPKDGIPALSNPKFLPADDARYLKATDRVIGVTFGKESRAYPVKILDQHEIVNDRIGDTLLAVTYCPLCDSVAIFDRRTELGDREFGVSGLLYNSNVLMYDRGGDVESLWSQMGAQGVTGPAAGKPLKSLPFELTTWESWRSRYPATQVMSSETGHRRDYDRSLYERYFATSALMFPVKPQSRQLPAKARVLGIWTGKSARAYPVAAFGKESQRVKDTLDGQQVEIEYDADSQTLRVLTTGDSIQWTYSFWFAWYAFRPNTDVYKLKP